MAAVDVKETNAKHPVPVGFYAGEYEINDGNSVFKINVKSVLVTFVV